MRDLYSIAGLDELDEPEDDQQPLSGFNTSMLDSKPATKGQSPSSGSKQDKPDEPDEPDESVEPTASPEFEAAYARVERRMRELGYSITRISKFRDPEKQNSLYQIGRTVRGRNASPQKPMGDTVTNADGYDRKSRHQTADAFDVVFQGGTPNWREFGRIAKEEGLEWGGDFSNLYDPGHIQWPKSKSQTRAAQGATSTAPAAADQGLSFTKPNLSLTDIAKGVKPAPAEAAPEAVKPTTKTPVLTMLDLPDGWNTAEERKFAPWYAAVAQQYGLSENPDDPEHHYNYRFAFKQGARPDADGHWPSAFKDATHPNRYVDGIDTITGLPQTAATAQAKPPSTEGFNTSMFEDAPSQGETRDIRLAPPATIHRDASGKPLDYNVSMLEGTTTRKPDSTTAPPSRARAAQDWLTATPSEAEKSTAAVKQHAARVAQAVETFKPLNTELERHVAIADRARDIFERTEKAFEQRAKQWEAGPKTDPVEFAALQQEAAHLKGVADEANAAAATVRGFADRLTGLYVQHQVDVRQLQKEIADNSALLANTNLNRPNVFDLARAMRVRNPLDFVPMAYLVAEQIPVVREITEGVAAGTAHMLTSAIGVGNAVGVIPDEWMKGASEASKMLSPEVSQRKIKDDPWGTIGNWRWWATTAVGEQLPFLVGLGAAGKIAQTAKGAAQIAAIGESVIEGGGFYVEAIEAGASKNNARMAAAFVAAMNYPGLLVTDISLFSRDAKTYLGNILKKGAVELTQEDYQTVLSNLTAMFSHDPNRKWNEGLLESTVLAGSMGATFGALQGPPVDPNVKAALIDEYVQFVTNNPNETFDPKSPAGQQLADIMRRGAKAGVTDPDVQAALKAVDEGTYQPPPAPGTGTTEPPPAPGTPPPPPPGPPPGGAPGGAGATVVPTPPPPPPVEEEHPDKAALIAEYVAFLRSIDNQRVEPGSEQERALKDLTQRAQAAGVMPEDIRAALALPAAAPVTATAPQQTATAVPPATTADPDKALADDILRKIQEEEAAAAGAPPVVAPTPPVVAPTAAAPVLTEGLTDEQIMAAKGVDLTDRQLARRQELKLIAKRDAVVTPTPPVVAPTPAAAVQPSGEATVATGATAQPGGIYRIPPTELLADPNRFQFKGGADVEGVTQEAKIEGPWNPNRGGILLAWKDPENGKLYVINGHHRLEAAKRLGADEVVVRVVEPMSVAAARLEGALTNIAEDKGTAIDAAKVIRGGKLTKDELQRVGISPRTRLARDGMALAQLSDPIFQRVATGEIEETLGVAIGAANLSPSAQQSVATLVDQQKAKGRELTAGQLKALIEDVSASAEVTADSDQGNIFTDLLGEERTQNTAVEKAALRDWLSTTLKKDKRLFGFVAKGDRAKRLAEGGNIINKEASAARADEAAQIQAVFDTLATKAGPISKALNEAAARIVQGDNVNAVRQELLAAVRDAVAIELGRPAPDRVPVAPTGGLPQSRPVDTRSDQPRGPEAGGQHRDKTDKDVDDDEPPPTRQEGPGLFGDDEPPAAPPQTDADKLAEIHKERADAIAALKAKLGSSQANIGVDPEIVTLVVRILRTYIKEGLVNFRKVIARFHDEWGSRASELDEYIEGVWEDLTDEKVSVKDAVAANAAAARDDVDPNEGQPRDIDPPGVDAVVFRSGNSRAPNDLQGHINAGQPVGIAALSKNRKDPSKPFPPSGRVLAMLADYAKAGGKVFVDSGAFGIPDVDFKRVFGIYMDILARVGKAHAGNVYLTMPDKVGDAEKTLALQETHAARIRSFIEAGANVIVPVQVFDGAAKREMSQVSRDAMRVARAFPSARIGLPGNAAAITPKELEWVTGVLKAEGVYVAGFHFLGVGETGRGYDAFVKAVRDNYPQADITADSNRTRAMMGEGRGPYEDVARITEDRATDRVDATPDADTTELAGYFYRGELQAFSKGELETIATALDVTVEKLRSVAADVETVDEDGDSALQDLINAIGGDQYFDLVIHRIAKTRAEKAVRPGVRTEVIARADATTPWEPTGEASEESAYAGQDLKDVLDGAIRELRGYRAAATLIEEELETNEKLTPDRQKKLKKELQGLLDQIDGMLSEVRDAGGEEAYEYARRRMTEEGPADVIDHEIDDDTDTMDDDGPPKTAAESLEEAVRAQTGDERRAYEAQELTKLKAELAGPKKLSKKRQAEVEDSIRHLEQRLKDEARWRAMIPALEAAKDLTIERLRLKTPRERARLGNAWYAERNLNNWYGGDDASPYNLLTEKLEAIEDQEYAEAEARIPVVELPAADLASEWVGGKHIEGPVHKQIYKASILNDEHKATKAFSLNGKTWVMHARHGDTYHLQEVVPAAEWTGPTYSYKEKIAQWDRNDDRDGDDILSAGDVISGTDAEGPVSERGSFEGLAITIGGKDYVSTGQKLYVKPVGAKMPTPVPEQTPAEREADRQETRRVILEHKREREASVAEPAAPAATPVALDWESLFATPAAAKPPAPAATPTAAPPPTQGQGLLLVPGIGDEPIGFGKHAKMLVKDLAREQPGYANWLFENGTFPRAKQVAAYLATDPVFTANRTARPVATFDAAAALAAVTPEALAVLKPFKITAVPHADGSVTLAGSTYDHKETIRQVGGGDFQRDGSKTWRLPPAGFTAFVNDLQRRLDAGERPGVPKAAYKSDSELARLRKFAEGGPDRRDLESPVESYVREDTQKLIELGLTIGMPPVVVEEQIEDVARIVRGYNDKLPLFLLASEPGSGKTFVLGGAIREILHANPNAKITYVTLRQELISQIKKDLAAYGIERVRFITYPKLRTTPAEASDVIIFDEAHSAKNVQAEGSAQAKAAAEWIEASGYPILATATPFENPVQAQYLESTGVFDSFGDFAQWAKAFGATGVKLDSGASVLSWRRTQTSDEDAKAARDWFNRLGVFTSRRIRLPHEQVDSRLVKIDVSKDQADRYDAFSQAAADEADKLGGFARAWIINFQKRLLEAAKVQQGIKEAKAARARGRFPIIFVETKAERKLDIPDLMEREAEWQMAVAMALSMREKPPARSEYGLPPQGIVDVLARYMSITSQETIEIPSAEDEVIKAFGAEEVAIFTGSVTPKKAQDNLDAWRQGTKPVMVATMAKGGTGLSLHDKVGDHQTTQININLPWTATQVVQVAQRSARYGLKGRAEMQWIFADNIPFDRTLALRVGGRMADMGAVVHGERLSRSDEIAEWDFEDDLFSDAAPAELADETPKPPPVRAGAVTSSAPSAELLAMRDEQARPRPDQPVPDRLKPKTEAAPSAVPVDELGLTENERARLHALEVLDVSAMSEAERAELDALEDKVGAAEASQIAADRGKVREAQARHNEALQEREAARTRPRRNAADSTKLEEALSPKAQAGLDAWFKKRNASRDLRHIREALEVYDRLLDTENLPDVGPLETDAQEEAAVAALMAKAKTAAVELLSAAEAFFATGKGASRLQDATWEGLKVITGKEDPDPAELLENEVFASAEDAGRLIFDTLDPKTASFDTEEFNTAYGDVEFRREPDEVFPPPEETVNLWKGRTGRTVISQAEGQAQIDKWKAEAKAVGAAQDNSKRVIISLFDRTGIIAQPWRDAGYHVRQFDIRAGDDLTDFGKWMAEIEELISEGYTIEGVLAQPPCTSFTSSGSQHWPSKHDAPNREWLVRTYGEAAAEYFDTPVDYANTLVAVVKLVVGQAAPRFYVMENPVGRIQTQNHLPEPVLKFHPDDFGEPYTKATQLWGEFNPHLPTARVGGEESLGGEGSRTWNLSSAQKDERAQTPVGFAYAFFVANQQAASVEDVDEDKDAEVFSDEALARLTAEERVRLNALFKANESGSLSQAEAAELSALEDKAEGSEDVDEETEDVSEPAPPATPERAERIERIVAMARKAPDEVVERFEYLGSNGKYYQVFGVPLGVTLGDEKRSLGFAYRAADGTYYGNKRYDTAQEAKDAQQARQDAQDKDFRDHLTAMSDERLDSQEEYWTGEVAKRDRLKAPFKPPRTLKQVAESHTPPADRDEYLSQKAYQASVREGAGPTNIDRPNSAIIPAVGTWMIDDTFKGADGHGISQLVDVAIDNIEISEDSAGRFDYVEQYARWLNDGFEAPPITVLQTDKGTLKTIDHRRLLAAKAAGRTSIKAWVSWSTENPRHKKLTTELTYELAQKGARPLMVAPAMPAHTITKDDQKRLDEVKRRLKPRELDQEEQSYLEWEENAGRVTGNPEAASTKDILRAMHYLDHRLRRALTKKNEGLADSLEREIAYLRGLADARPDRWTRLRQDDESPLRQAADVLSTGEIQPRLPGDVGDVREREIASPRLAAEEALTTGYTKAAMKLVFQLTDAMADAVDALVQAIGLDTSRIRLGQGSSDRTGLKQEEKDRRLSILHNLSTDNLIYADELGGLVMPSMGVVRPDMAMEGYGGVTLIGRSGLANPRETPIFDADIYSARFPRPSYPKAKSAVAQRLLDRFKAFTRLFDDKHIEYTFWDNAVNTPNPADTISRMMQSEAAKAWFLKEKLGVEVKPRMKAKDARYGWNWMPAWVDFVKTADFSAENEAWDSPERTALYVAAGKAASKAIDEYVSQKSYMKGEDEDLRARLAKTFNGNVIDPEDGRISLSVFHNARADVANKGTKRVDGEKTRKALDKALTGHEAEFKAWIDDTVLGMHGDPYFPIGRRKAPVTAENALDAMQRQPLQASEKTLTFGEGKARAKSAKRMTSTDEMRNRAEWQLSDKGEVDAARATAKKALEEWRNAAVEYYGDRYASGSAAFGRVWEGLDASMRALARWTKSGTKDGMRRALYAEGFRGVPDEVLEQGVMAGRMFADAPVPYFEAKPERVVKLSEFAGAVVPANADENVLAVLDKHNIPYTTYPTEYNEPERKAATIKFRDELAAGGADVLFQREPVNAPAMRNWYYSNVSKALDSWQKKGTPAQLLAHLKKMPGAMEEAKAIGLADWLEHYVIPMGVLDVDFGPRQTVTRDEAQRFVESRQIQVTTIKRGEPVDVSAVLQTPEVAPHVEALREMGYAVQLYGAEMPALEWVGEGPEPQMALPAAVQRHWEPIWKAIQTEGRGKYFPLRYESYVLPGGENQREVLLTLPASRPVGPKVYDGAGGLVQPGIAAGWQMVEGGPADGLDFISSHWDTPNVVVHLRLNDRIINGKRVLFAEEIQSDWGQRGRKRGYESDRLARNAKVDDIREQLRAIEDLSERPAGTDRKETGLRNELATLLAKDFSQAVPDMPFKGNAWKKLALKRLLALAAEGGYDGVAWTTGEQQIERYKLSQKVSSIDWQVNQSEIKDVPGEYRRVQINLIGGDTIKLHLNDQGTVTWASHGDTRFLHRTLDEIIGKDLAEKVSEGTGGFIEGVDLDLGSKGMIGFYDKELPNLANDLVKKYGTTVGTAKVPTKHTLQARVRPGGEWIIYDPVTDAQFVGPETGWAEQTFDTKQEAEAAMREYAPGKMTGETVHFLELPQALREDIVDKGLPLFQGEKASVTFVEDGNAIIRALKSADVSSAIHELAHVLRRQLMDRNIDVSDRAGVTDEDIVMAAEWAGARLVNGQYEWTEAAEEKFARGFERYLYDGKAPTAALQPLFDKFRGWLMAIYRQLSGSSLDVDISPAMRQVFDRLLTRQARISAQAYDTPTKTTQDAWMKPPPKARKPKAMSFDFDKDQQTLFQRAAAVGSETFKRWFGKSVVVNRDGTPKQVFHGTGSLFTDFDGYELPGWFTASSEQASNYSKQGHNRVIERGAYPGTADGPHIVPVYLSIQKPLSIGFDANENMSLDAFIAKFPRLDLRHLRHVHEGKVLDGEAGEIGSAWEFVNTAQFAEAARTSGYDGIAITERGIQTWAVLDNKQAKSSIANRGTYDPKSPNILRQITETPTVAAAPTSPEFQKWFEGSKVVDKDGVPLRAYHGTRQDFDSFNTRIQRKERSSYNWLGDLGSWFSAPSLYPGNYDEGNAESVAETFAESIMERTSFNDRFGEGANIVPVYLSIQNPMEYEGWEDLDDARGGTLTGKALREKLQAEGYDGIVVRNSMTDGNTDRDDWIAFEPTQIKSAIGNRGTFDPTNPSIVLQLSEAAGDRVIADAPKKRVYAAGRITKGLDKLSKGQITDDAFVEEMERLRNDLLAKKDAREEAAYFRERERGYDIVVEKLIAARRRGHLSHETVEFALWVLEKNPDLASRLGISIRKSGQAGVAGFYNRLDEIITIIKGNSSPSTVVHELLHHTERMMPAEVQAGIRREWWRAVMAAMKTANETGNEKQIDAYTILIEGAMGFQAAHQAATEFFINGTLPRDQYHLLNPSEFWAENAGQLLAQRYNARESWVRQAIQWLDELVDRIANWLGLESDAPVLRGLDAIMRADGDRVSREMIGNISNAPLFSVAEDKAKKTVTLVRSYVAQGLSLQEAINQFHKDFPVESYRQQRIFEMAWEALTGQKPPKWAGNINLDKFPVPNNEKREFALIVTQNDEYMKQRRGVVTWEETRALAVALPMIKMVPKPGSAFNASELEALAGHVIATRQQLGEVTAQMAAGDNQSKTVARHAQLMAQLQVLLETLSGATAEAGRALNILAKVRALIATDDDDFLQAAIDQLGGREDIEKIAKRLAEFGDDRIAKYRFIKSLAKVGVADWISWYWYTNLLSGPLTQARNLLGNSSQLAFSMASQPLAAGVDSVRALVTGTPRTVMLSEMPSAMLGLWHGAYQGAKNAAFMMRNGFTMEDVVSLEFRPPEVPGGAWTNVVGRGLEAADVFFRSMRAMSELYSMAYVAANQSGHKPGSAEYDAVFQTFVAIPPLEAMKAIQREAKRSTFREDPGSFMKAIMDSRKDFKITLPSGRVVKLWNPLRMFIPFVQTPANIMKMSAEATPLGFLMAPLRQSPRERSQSAGRAALATALLTPLVMLAMRGLVSGSGPDDKELKDELYRQGWQPNSIRIGDAWYNYSNLQPLALPLSLIANWYESYLYNGETFDFGTIVAKTAKSVLQQSYLSGLQAVQEAIENSDRYGSAYIEKMIQSWSPLSSFRSQVTRAIDPVIRQPDTIAETLQANTPGLSEGVRPRRDAFGEEATRGSNILSRLFNPITISEVKDSPLERELYALRNDYQVGFPSRTVTVAGQTVKLTADEYDAFLRDSGQTIKKQLTTLIAHPTWARRTPANKASLVEQAVSAARAGVRAQLLLKVRDRVSAGGSR